MFWQESCSRLGDPGGNALIDLPEGHDISWLADSAIHESAFVCG
jgi:hypothetical protein